MSVFSFKEISRGNWGKSVEKTITSDDLRTGALLRIAEACEKMAANTVALIESVQVLERQRAAAYATADKVERSNAALRGHVTRLKRIARQKRELRAANLSLQR